MPARNLSIDEQVALPNDALADQLRGLVAQISEDAKIVLRFVVLYEVIERREIKIDSLSWDATQDALRECEKATLIIGEHDSASGFAPMHVLANLRSFYYVRQERREILKRMLYPPKEKAD